LADFPAVRSELDTLKAAKGADDAEREVLVAQHAALQKFHDQYKDLVANLKNGQPAKDSAFDSDDFDYPQQSDRRSQATGSSHKGSSSH
jgi:hypothetical protein